MIDNTPEPLLKPDKCSIYKTNNTCKKEWKKHMKPYCNNKNAFFQFLDKAKWP